MKKNERPEVIVLKIFQDHGLLQLSDADIEHNLIFKWKTSGIMVAGMGLSLLVEFWLQ